MALSGGQRQRIAIARCIVRQPPILILDEATSSMDVHSERIVQAALARVLKNRTTILIAHRLSTVRKADRIVVIKDGTNLEEGSHDELVAAGGMYCSLVHAQELGNISVCESERLEQKDILPDEAMDNVAITRPGIGENHQQIPREVQCKPGEKGRPSTKILLRILRQQRQHWLLYSLTLLGALGASCKCVLRVIGRSELTPGKLDLHCRVGSLPKSCRLSSTPVKDWLMLAIFGPLCSSSWPWLWRVSTFL